MITPTVKTGQPLLIATKVGINKFIFEYQVASTKYQVGKETRAKSREARTKKQETRTKSREEIELFAVRFLCACLPPLDLQNSIILRTAIVINNEGGLGGD